MTAQASPANDSMIEVRDLRFGWSRGRRGKSFGESHDTLAIEHLTIARGDSVFLHGPSGSGKSTLLGLLAGVLLPRAGSVSVLGQDWAALDGFSGGVRRDAFRADHVGYVFQQFNLLPYLSVLDNTLLPCRFSKLRLARATQGAGSAAAAAQGLLERVGLNSTLWARPAAQLSVGQQQRVAAARALIGAPELVIADEPTSALDATLRDDFMDLLLGACRKAGSTLVFVSHDERLAGRFEARLSLPALNSARQEEGAA